MKFQVIPVTAYMQNCTLLWCEETNKAAVVDPGGDLDRIEQAMAQNGVELEKIFVTHGHLDHAGGVADLAEKYGVPVEGPHKEDLFWIEMLPKQGQMMGLPFQARDFEPTRWLNHGDTVEFGNQVLEVLHCPGHTPGHVVLFHGDTKLALVGDVLFQGSIGRTDFPKGDHATLIDAIRTRLWPLGDDVSFIPGHGPMSNFGQERRTNPFVADPNYG
jgi:glyoxylase-like metal-dependent hydrolase (beta-lactamase superfamily II)